MDQGLFIALLTPVVMTLLGSAFLVFGALQRRRRHIFVLGTCYLLAAVGFTIQSFDLGLGLTVKKFAANVIFVAAMLLLSGAAICRQNIAVPYVSFGVMGVATLSIFSWFLFVDVDFMMRVFAINFGLGAMCFVTGILLTRSRRQALIDRVVTWMAFLGAADFIVRPIILAWLGMDGSSVDKSLSSSYWLMTNLSAIVFCLLLALSLLSAVAIDAMRELSTESRTDPLSGLLNRRGFEEQAAPYLAGQAADAAPISLIIADLDHFKEVNDVYGHDAGDRLINDFAQLLGRESGPEAIVARTGGEEFALLLPNTDLAAACLLAECIRRSVPALRQEGASGIVSGRTCSLGVTMRSGDEGLWALLHRADEALLGAKRTGRDSVRSTFSRPVAPPTKALRATG